MVRWWPSCGRALMRGFGADILRRMRRAVVKIAWLSMLLGCLGCQRALFPKSAPRTQFDMHERMRSRSVPLEEPDVFGRPQPALRARLSRRY